MPVRAPTASTKPTAAKENPYVSLSHSKGTGKKGTKPPSPKPGPASVPGKPAMPTKPAMPSSPTVRGHAALQCQATLRGQGQTAVQGQQGIYHTVNQPAPLILANPAYQANSARKAPPSSQAVFAAAGTEAARQATKRLSRQTPPTSPALVGHPTLNHPPSHSDVKDMSVDEITEWMRRMNMAQYTDVIVTNGVDGTLLKSLDEDILTREFGFTRFNAIKLLKFANEGYRPT